MAEDAPSTDAFKSGLFEDSTGHTIEDYPGEIENEYLLGVDEAGGWYFNPINEGIRNYRLEGGDKGRPLELTLEFSMDKEEAKDTFSDVSELADDLVDRTVFGHSLVLSKELAEHTHFSEPQAKVYSLREVYGVGRTQTARILNKSANTIDNQRRNAKTKADKAKAFVKIVQQYSPNNR